MAYTLTFDESVYCQVNGVPKDSPYTLRNGDVITVAPNYGNFVVNNTTYSASTANTIDISNSDITITKGGSVPALNPVNTTINFSEAAANRISVDMSTLSGWANLASGSHTLTIKGKADGYTTSDASTGVSFAKVAQGYSVKINATSPANYPSTGDTIGIKVDGVQKWQSTWTTNAQTVSEDLGTGSIVEFTGSAEYHYTMGGTEYTTDFKNPVVTLTGDFVLTWFYASCLTGDMLITLADGSQKRIDQLTLYDKVLSYNPSTMKLEADEITYTDSTENKKHTEYDIWTFSNGTIIKTVHRHRLYNVEKQAMVYMDEWKIGEHAVNINDEYAELVGHENVKEEVHHYTLFTKNQNYFVNGLLSGNRHTMEMHL